SAMFLVTALTSMLGRPATGGSAASPPVERPCAPDRVFASEGFASVVFVSAGFASAVVCSALGWESAACSVGRALPAGGADSCGAGPACAVCTAGCCAALDFRATLPAV